MVADSLGSPRLPFNFTDICFINGSQSRDSCTYAFTCLLYLPYITVLQRSQPYCWSSGGDAQPVYQHVWPPKLEHGPYSREQDSCRLGVCYQFASRLEHGRIYQNTKSRIQCPGFHCPKIGTLEASTYATQHAPITIDDDAKWMWFKNKTLSIYNLMNQRSIGHRHRHLFG